MRVIIRQIMRLRTFKMILNKKILLPLLSSAFFALTLAHADEALLTKEKCGACHGDTGNSLDEKVPSIAGFSSATILDALEEFKTGDRKGDKFTPKGGKESDMEEVANHLSEEDAQIIAKYLSKQTFKPIKQDFDEALAKRGNRIHDRKCEKCHSSGASDASDDAGILAGQYKTYLQKQFESVISGERSVSRKMKRQFKRLSEKNRNALIHFYISEQ